MCQISKKVQVLSTAAEVVMHMPSFDAVHRQLSRHRAERCLPVPDPLKMPELRRTTLRGREADDDSPDKNEPFLLYEGQDVALYNYGISCLTDFTGETKKNLKKSVHD